MNRQLKEMNDAKVKEKQMRVLAMSEKKMHDLEELNKAQNEKFNSALYSLNQKKTEEKEEKKRVLSAKNRRNKEKLDALTQDSIKKQELIVQKIEKKNKVSEYFNSEQSPKKIEPVKKVHDISAIKQQLQKQNYELIQK